MTAEVSPEADDFAAEPVPDEARVRWPSIFFAIIGIGTALFFMQVTSIIAMKFGSAVALCAIAYASIVTAPLGFLAARISIRTGFGVSLLARLILGYRGAAFFSLLFGVTTFIYFAAEASIMGAALEGVSGGLPSWIILPGIAALMVPLVWFGMRVLARFQFVTFILYVVLLGTAVAMSIPSAGHRTDWLHYQPAGAPSFWVGLLESLSIMNGVVFITGILTADYTRYVRKSDMRWACWVIGAGFPVFCFAFSGLLGLWFSVHYREANPGVYFVTILGVWGTVFAVATQLRINLANMYSGSIAFVNMFKQAVDLRVSRHVAIVLFGTGVSVALVMNVLDYLLTVMSIIGMFTTCFTVLLLLELYGMKTGRFGALDITAYAPGTIPNWRWPALGSLVVAASIGSFLLTGGMGPIGVFWASFAAGGAQIILYAAVMGIGGRASVPGGARRV